MELSRGASPTASTGARSDGYFRVLASRKWIVIGTVIVIVAGVLALSMLITPKYQSSAKLVRQNAALDQTLFGTTVFQIQDAARDLRTGAEQVKLNAVAGMVKQDIQSSRSTGSLLSMVSVTVDSNSDIIVVSAVSTDAQEAAALANSFAREFILFRQQADKAILAQASNQVRAELDQMSTADRQSARGSVLEQKYEELGVLESMQTGGYQVVEQGQTPASPISPRPVRWSLYALVGSLIIGVLLAFVVEYSDKRIRDAADLERYLALPILAWVPRISGRSKRRNKGNEPVGFATPDNRMIEPFRTLRSNLKFFGAKRPIQVLAVTSGVPSEGKTITAINLALSLALSGSRVILVEADLRKPSIHAYLGLPNQTGLSTLLAGGTQVDRIFQHLNIEALAGDLLSESAKRDAKRLQDTALCVTSGPLPPNPAELLSSPQMEEFIKAARMSSDYVIVDTPPLLLFSDALNFAGWVDGLLVCARMGTTTFTELAEVREILQRSRFRALGVVLNGVRRRHGAYYGTYRTSYAERR